MEGGGADGLPLLDAMKLGFLGAASSPHVIKWVNALSAKGHAITLYTMPNEQDQLGEISSRVTIVNMPHAEAQGGLRKNVSYLKSAIPDAGYKAVAAFDMLTYGNMAARASLPHVLLVSTGLDIINGMRAGEKSTIQKSVKEAVAVCATAPNVITRIKEVYSKDKDKPFFVTPFGVDMDLFKKKEVSRSSAFTFGSLKRLEYYNHVDDVISAFAEFRNKCGMESLLRVAGNGPAMDDLVAQAKKLGIEENVEFLGYVRNTDMPDVINTLDVAVQMPDDECLGISAIEAMACEVPVVSSETDGASEYILNGVTGYLVRAGNINRCSDRMMKLATHPEEREKMGFDGRRDVMENYSLPECVEKFEEALQAASGSRVN